MGGDEAFDVPHWYLIHTHSKQESRVEGNLRVLLSEIYLPRRLIERSNSFTDQKEFAVRPLFPRYLFARFKVTDFYQKISFTRGVHAVVKFGETLAIVDDEVVELIRSRESKDGLVRVQETFECGDVVLINHGPLRNLVGVFERSTSDADRVMLLLQAVGYQAHAVLERRNISRVSSPPQNLT